MSTISNTSKSMLVTGGAGFIGTNFVHYWRKKYPLDKLVVLDLLTYAGNDENLSGMLCDKFEFIQGCISDGDLILQILKQHQISHIVHFAAESHVDRSIHDPDVFMYTNVIGTHTLLKSALNYMETTQNNIHFHHISTDEVYGALNATSPGFNEDSRFQPNSPYSASKAASDHLVRAYHVTYGLPVTISNCSNNYGPFQNREKLIPLMIHNILEGLALPVYGEGRNIRDWIFVEDHCRAIDTILSQGKIGETYNVGGGTELSNIALVERICADVEELFLKNGSLKHQFPKAPAARGKKNTDLITFVTDRKGHDFRYAIDDTKIRKTLGFIPRYSFNEGLSRTLAWYLQQKIKLSDKQFGSVY